MPELMEIRRTDYHSEVCIATDDFGPHWVPIDEWIAENTIIEVNDRHMSLDEGLRIWSFWNLKEDLVDSLKDCTLTDWYWKLYDIRFAEGWNEINRIIEENKPCLN